jgi:hypothetical protein
MKQFLFLAGAWWLSVSSPCFAQHETDHWACGNYSFFRFGSGLSQAGEASRMRQLEGSAVVSDAQSGQLLFYSDGVSVWGKDHQLLPNGTGLKGSPTSTQSALIVPFPGREGQYYLFSVKAYDDGPDGSLHYSVVDTRLRNGLGDVTEKNRLLESMTTEKLTAVPHANGHDYWILSHAWNSDAFLVYLLTSEGITESKRMAVGSFHAKGKVSDAESMGYLKASPNGKMLAAAVYGTDRPFEVFDFDAGKGEITNARSLGNFTGQYGVSFSPDNTRLYLTGLYAHQDAYVFDLKAGTKKPLAIGEESRSGKQQLRIAGALQLGIDGRLYTSFGRAQVDGTYKLAVLETPDRAEPSPAWLTLPGRNRAPVFGLPNFMQSVFNTEKTGISSGEKTLAYPNPVSGGTLTIFQKAVTAEAVRVTDLQGKDIRTGDIKLLPDRIVLNTASWPSGQTYLVQVAGVSYKIVKI